MGMKILDHERQIIDTNEKQRIGNASTYEIIYVTLPNKKHFFLNY